MCYGVGSEGVEIGLKGTKQPCREVTGWSLVYAREGWAAVMKGGAVGAGPGTETSKLATSLEAIFLFFLKTGIDRC